MCGVIFFFNCSATALAAPVSVAAQVQVLGYGLLGRYGESRIGRRLRRSTNGLDPETFRHRMNDLTRKLLIDVLRIFRPARIEPEQAQTGESGERSARGAIETSVSVWCLPLPRKDRRTASVRIPLSETLDVRP